MPPPIIRANETRRISRSVFSALRSVRHKVQFSGNYHEMATSAQVSINRLLLTLVDYKKALSAPLRN